MQRSETVAKTILELIIKHDGDGTGVFRSDLYSFAERELPRSLVQGDMAATVDYHLYLLEDAGFVNMVMGETEAEDESEDEDAMDSDYFMLTWAGHDYLDNK
ncbi:MULTISPECIES: DUF2513 domain-containing protein [Pseudomonas]|uniref:DUF2513 domain-containing protein n=1 Tax=Pseudomonas fluorescens TaxID=294 RepID=A0A5E6VUT1_PSEFL|nr:MULTISPECIES: DUF2513 domain-containing protein [Pseudomonas]VVN18894.1 hypothetical protein PS652_04217 [Pseudomonas fluorescens]